MKIRTDFVTNSSSSSFIAISVYMKDGRTLYASWDSGNINVEYVSAIELSEKEWRSLKTGDELLKLCYEYADETSSEWYTNNNEKREAFQGTVDAISAIKDIPEEVAKISIETKLSIYKPMYEATDSFNYLTGKRNHSETEPEDYDEESYDEDDGKVYYYAGTFEDDIYNSSIEKQIIQKCSSLPKETLQYIISNCDITNNNDNGKAIYECLARFYAGEQYTLEELHDVKLYFRVIDNMVADYEMIQSVEEMFDSPELINCKGLTFVTTFLEPYEEEMVSKEVTERGGFVRGAVSGKTDVLIAKDVKSFGKKLSAAIENKKNGKNIMIITFDHYMKLVKEGKLV